MSDYGHAHREYIDEGISLYVHTDACTGVRLQLECKDCPRVDMFLSAYQIAILVRQLEIWLDNVMVEKV